MPETDAKNKLNTCIKLAQNIYLETAGSWHLAPPRRYVI